MEKEKLTAKELSKRIVRKNRQVNAAAFIPNSIELGAIKEQGFGLYPGKESIFVRRFPHPRSNLERTSKKAIDDFKIIRKVHKNYNHLFFALRTTDKIFSKEVMNNIEIAQFEQKHFVLHEHNINQKLSSYEKHYTGYKNKYKEIIPILDPGMLSPVELKRKAEFVAKQKPKTLIVTYRNPINYSIQYLQIANAFIELNTRIIVVGYWPRYVTRGKNFGCTSIPLTLILYGFDAFCHGVATIVNRSKKPSILFLDGVDWRYVTSNMIDRNKNILGTKLFDYFKKGKDKEYNFSRAQSIIEGDAHIKNLINCKEEELLNKINQSDYLSDMIRKFNSVWQEG